jgi:hypothetical protein
MSDAPSPSPSGRAARAFEHMKTGAAVIGALVGALSAMWGFYHRVRTEARANTAASYNTLAPQVNQLGEALRQLQLENQKLRDVVAQSSGRSRIAASPPRKAKPKPAEPAPSAPAADQPPPVATERAPAADAGAPAAPVPTPPPSPPEAGSDDPVTDLLETVGRTRAAIESLRKVPEDFGRVLELEKKESSPPLSGKP